MPGSTRPFLALYVVSHPRFASGRAVATAVFDHYRREVFLSVAGASGVSVQFRMASALGAVPLPIDPEEAETTAIVILVDRHLLEDAAWVAYCQRLADLANAYGLRVRLFPVAISSGAIQLSAPLGRINFIRWDNWEVSVAQRRERLVGRLTYECCRMLRRYLEHLRRPGEGIAELEAYLRKVRVFLSHSKHDADGVQMVSAIRGYIQHTWDLEAFFDVTNIPAGLNFDDVLEHYVRVSAVIAVQSNSYSSRAWCRREIIEAKRSSVPLIVANCLSSMEDRGFPYLGNVPVVRMARPTRRRLEVLINRLIDEVFKDFLWRCRIEISRKQSYVVFVPRAPELISLLVRDLVPTGRRRTRVIVYPDPPLGAEEAELLAAMAPGLKLLSHTAWTALPS